MYEIQRLRLVDGQPIAIERVELPAGWLPNLEPEGVLPGVANELPQDEQESGQRHVDGLMHGDGHSPLFSRAGGKTGPPGFA